MILNWQDSTNKMGEWSTPINFLILQVYMMAFFDKRTKNKNKTGSNLSLGRRLMVLSKRLGRKRCCGTTPNRCLEVCRLTIFASHYKKKILRLIVKKSIGWENSVVLSAFILPIEY